MYLKLNLKQKFSSIISYPEGVEDTLFISSNDKIMKAMGFELFSVLVGMSEGGGRAPLGPYFMYPQIFRP